MDKILWFKDVNNNVYCSMIKQFSTCFDANYTTFELYPIIGEVKWIQVGWDKEHFKHCFVWVDTHDCAHVDHLIWTPDFNELWK